MPNWVLTLFVGALAAAAGLLWLPPQVGPRGDVYRTVLEKQPLAEALLIQHQAAYQWAITHQGYVGAVPTNQLAIPAPWSLVSGATSTMGLTANGMVLVTTYQGNSRNYGGIVASLTDLMYGSSDVGMTSASGLVNSGPILPPLPTGIPNGVPAIMDQAPT